MYDFNYYYSLTFFTRITVFHIFTTTEEELPKPLPLGLGTTGLSDKQRGNQGLRLSCKVANSQLNFSGQISTSKFGH